MHEEQTRINATISYFILGPFFLLARNGTPLADPYVRLHAKRASIIMAFGLVGYSAYFLLKPLLTWTILSIPLTTIVLGAITSIMLGYLIFSAYKAYNGESMKGGVITGTDTSYLFHVDSGEKTDAEKIRIGASYIPLLGIWLSSKYNDEIILIGRKVGTLMFLLIISSSLFLNGSTGLTLILILLSIILIVFSWVSLFMMGRFPVFLAYKWIPSYIELETHVSTSVTWMWMMMKVLGGSEKTVDYTTLYHEKLSQIQTGFYTQTLIVSPRTIGIPIINLITLPALFQDNQKEYKNVILQGITLTILFVLIWILLGFNNGMQLFLLIPMVHLLSFAQISPYTRAPGVDTLLIFTSLFGKGKAKIEAEKAKEASVSHSYPTPEETKSV